MPVSGGEKALCDIRPLTLVLPPNPGPRDLMEMQTQSLAGDITKVNLTGRLDIMGAQKIDLHFNVVVGNHPRVIVDLEHVQFLASMGIRTLIMGAKTMKSKGGRMVLLKPTADVETVLTDSGTDTIVPIVHDLDAAIAAVSG
jgi:anti-sigma B factor antagonist